LVQSKQRAGFHQMDMLIDCTIRSTFKICDCPKHALTLASRTVQTGLITAVVATIDLFIYVFNPTGLHLIFNFPLCKLYSNSLMSTFNSR
ncbi:hypothetical protein CPB84DRAFT_1661517, partial [Gymnopilus junonius]